MPECASCLLVLVVDLLDLGLAVLVELLGRLRVVLDLALDLLGEHELDRVGDELGRQLGQGGTDAPPSAS